MDAFWSGGLPEGFEARAPAVSDAEDVTALIAAGELAVSGTADVTLEDLTSDWNQPSFDLQHDAIVVARDQELVAYAEQHRGRAVVWVHPHVEGRGLGTALLDWTEQRARSAGQPDVGQTLNDGALAARTLLEGRGYERRWDSWVFQLDLDEPRQEASPPPGINLRTLGRPDDERAVHALIESSFSAWPGRPAVPFEDWVAAHLDREDADPQLRLVAEDERGRVVGVALCLAYDDEGWISELAVAEGQRGRGIGRALLTGAFAAFHDNGLRTAGLNTDSRTGARDLYEKVGMRVVRSYARFGKSL